MKRLFTDGEKIKEICKTYPTPFHLYDEKGIREGVRRLKAAFSWNEDFQEYFAVKACPNPFLLKIMQAEGCGVDCSSYTELMIAEKLGFHGEDIMFSSNVTPAQDFQYARKLESIINLDDFSHIDFLAQNGGIPELICLRYNPGGDFRINGSIMGNPGDAKYGMTGAQIREAVKKLSKMGAKRFGIHAFLASNMLNPDYYPSLAAILFELIVTLHQETGATFEFVNLSGGIGIPYKPEDKPQDLEYIGAKVKEAYDRIIVPSPVKKLGIKTELGRYMTGSHGILVTKVIHEKKTCKDYIGVDACAVDLMRPAMYGAYHHITVLGKEEAPCNHTYDVTGGLCENNDKFAIDRNLPEIEIGDILAIHDTGAHGYAMGYNYNGKLKSAELLLKEDGSVQMIRRAETPKDYFATFDFCDILQ
ncbi:MAG: diaminopimelate decarboxylase [Clostridia bacterium]|nr:diaminopimelate decarboxylase [Clostridia bacterium]